MELTYTQRMLLWSMAALTILRWALAGLHDLSPDEAMLREWVRHPAVAGVQGGAGAAWLANVGTALFGNTSLGVRFFAPLLAALSSWMLYRVSRSLCGDKTAAWAVALFNLTPLANLAATQMRPETPGVFFLIAGMTAVWRGLRRASPWDWHWWLAGLAFGAGFVCWYGAAWGVAGTFLLLLGARRWRGFLLRPGPWLLLLVFAACAWPVWDWNRLNAMAGWHAAVDTLFPPQAEVKWIAPLYLAGQWYAGLTPVLFGAMLWALWEAVRRWGTSDAARFTTAFALPPLIAALAASLTAGPRAAWIAPALPGLCLLLPWAWENCLHNLRLKNHLQWLCVLPALLLTPPALDTELLRHCRMNLTWAHDPSRHWRAWRPTAQEAATIIRDAVPQANEGLFVIARDERLASELNFYLPLDLGIYRATPRHPRVQTVPTGVPDNEYFFWPRYDDTSGGKSAYLNRSALYFTDSASRTAPAALRDTFESVELKLIYDVLHRGLPVRRIKVFACTGYHGPQPAVPVSPDPP